MARKFDSDEMDLLKSAKSNESVSVDESQPAAGTNRRSWIGRLSIFFGSLVGAVPFVAGVVTFLDPLRGKRAVPKSREQASPAGKEGFIRVATLSGLLVGGSPQRFRVIADQRDAWNFSPDQPIGAVFLQRVSDQKVVCFNATCPHAGCSVACDGTAFHCPCHNSSFNLDGKKRVSGSGRENPSPRDMDELNVDADKLKEDEIWIEFKNFYTGRHEKVPKA